MVELLILALDVLLVPFLQLLKVVQGLVPGEVVSRRHSRLMNHVFEVED